MAHTSSMLDEATCTHPHVHAHALGHTCVFFTATVIRERASLLRYTYIFYLFLFPKPVKILVNLTVELISVLSKCVRVHPLVG
jgi:hypothetical protein